MSHNLFVAIAVSAPQDLPPIPGVDVALRGMLKWAETQEYAETLVFSDLGGEPVTARDVRERLKQTLDEKGPFERVVVYFVGHGFYRHPDQIWILSAGPNTNVGRASMSALRASLQTYRPEQIAIISDACQELALGKSGETLLLEDNPDGPRPRTYVDTLQATLPGAPAWAFDDGPQERFCLFSRVLTEFLLGEDDRAFLLANGARVDNVTSQTIYAQLPTAVETLAAEMRAAQTPDIDPGFPQTKDIYSVFAAEPPVLAPPPPGLGPPGFDEDLLRRPSIEDRLAPHRVVDPTLGRLPDSVDWSEGVQVMAMIHGPPYVLDSLAFVDGGRRRRLERLEDAISLLLSEEDPYEPWPTSRVALRTGYGDDVRIIGLPIFQRTRAILKLGDAGGCEMINWSQRESRGDEGWATAEDAWPYLQALQTGQLRPDDMIGVADYLRRWKHVNPALGVACAYLYDRIGDLESVARICHFYKAEGQEIPFDVALLSGGQMSFTGGAWNVAYPGAEADDDRRDRYVGMNPDYRWQLDYLWRGTPPDTHAVAGYGPLIPAGWSRLPAMRSRTARSLARLARFVGASPISTLEGEAAERAFVELFDARAVAEAAAAAPL